LGGVPILKPLKGLGCHYSGGLVKELVENREKIAPLWRGRIWEFIGVPCVGRD